MSKRRTVVLVLGTAALFGVITNPDFAHFHLYPMLAVFYLLVPWRAISRPMMVFWLLVPVLALLITRVDIIQAYTTGSDAGRFGTSYGAIGWHKWVRNLVNIPAVLIVGLGLPACLFLPAGLRLLLRERDNIRGWLCLLPVGLFALFMAFLAPITYYRHYLALLPAAALLAALGLYQTRWRHRHWFLAVFLAWPALLAVDLVTDYHQDPRLALRTWYETHGSQPTFASFYVSPPPGSRNTLLFRERYALGDAATLRRARYLILSENWYDTAFANELNGPLVHDLGRLIKTRPEYARFYRQALAGQHPHLQLEKSLEVRNFMPELWLHKRYYGTFQLFVGDVKIFRVVP